MSRSDVGHVIVVGGGAMGSAAAWRLALLGHRVTLLEQFGPGHTRGASHGTSRIFRHGYADPRYVDLAAAAAGLWRTLERVSGTRLVRWTGAVDHGDPASVSGVAAALQARGLQHEIISPAAAQRRWPGLRFDTVALHHTAAGSVHADAAVAALQDQAVRHGAVVRHRVAVRAVHRSGSGVRVELDGERLTADHAVLAGGAWSAGLAESVLPGGLPPLVTTQEQPAHFTPDAGLPAASEWPAFLHHPGAGYTGAGIYGLGSADGVKAGEHGTGPVVDPDHRPPVDQDRLARLQDYVATWLPGVRPDSAVPVSCLYTTTPDGNSIVDRRGPVTVAAGFSGHGFKFTPVIGELIARLVTGDDGSPGPTGARAPELSAALGLFSLSRPELAPVG